MAIVIPATVEAVTTRRDKTIKITIGTQELDPEKAGKLLGMQNKLGLVAISLEELSDEFLKDIDDAKKETDGGKSPSQRMRNVMIVWYGQDKKGFETFNAFYEYHMEKMINYLKSKLEQ